MDKKRYASNLKKLSISTIDHKPIETERQTQNPNFTITNNIPSTKVFRKCLFNNPYKYKKIVLED